MRVDRVCSPDTSMMTRAHYFSAGVDVDAPTREVGGRVRRTLLLWGRDKRERAGLSSHPVVWVRELKSDVIVKELTSSAVVKKGGLILAIRVS